ncbi:MAG: helix-turn-helix domain-containing protein, partial [bacterium]|nr:helix-turn-helix domain-containing protein [bacterium]
TEAVQLLDRLEQLFADAEQMPDMDQSLLDCRKAEIYSFYANLLINCHQPQRAEQAYQRYLATDYSQTPTGESLRYNYLQGTGRYNESIHYLRKREAQLIQEGNEGTYEHKNLLSIIVGIYEKQGAYGLAAQTYQEMSRISTLLAESDQKAASLELISLYESNEKKQTIHNQQVALRHIYEREFAIGISLLLLFLLTLWLLWQRWRIERKNRSLVQQIERSISDKQALQEVRQTLLALQTADRQPVPQPSGQPTSPVSEPEPKANPEANASDLQSEQLFQQIDAYIRQEQLFVQPAFNPDQLLLQFFISKSRLTRLIRTYTGGSFNEYVNNLRLDYSLQLMRENPQYTIEAIAEESGFQSRRTFYRLFRNRYEMTPSEYKQTKQSIQ